MSAAPLSASPTAAASEAAVAATTSAELAVDDAGGPPQEGEEIDPDATAEYAPQYFVERDEVLAAIRELGSRLLERCSSYDAIADDDETISRVNFLETTLSKYQEFPELVKHHLGDMITPLTDIVIRLLPEPSAVAGTIEADGAFDDRPRSAIHTVCYLLYIIAKVASPKATTAHFPHDVRLVEKVFYCLRGWQVCRQREWEVRYALLLWLSNLVLVPFALTTIDSTDDTSLGEQLLQCAIRFLSDPSKTSDGAALLIARLLTRPDSGARRDYFIDQSVIRIEEGAGGGSTTATAAGSGAGLLRALATTFKIGKRAELHDHALRLIPVVAKHALKSRDAVVTKTAVKLVQRLGLALLPQQAQAWRYQRQTADLEANLTGTTAAAPPPAKPQQHTDQEEEELGIPEELEIAVDTLLSALTHADTIVRYSAAKGIGRICERLPRDCADDIVSAVLGLFAVKENDCGWHGACLALAECCRRNVLLPERFDAIVPLVVAALTYDVSKGSYSVGAHVRDAACYVCWSVARAYKRDDLRRFVDAVAETLVVAACFDREVNVRRAAAAAFQECVGRLGDYPDGIAVIQDMDFFSLATSANAFTAVAPLIARFDRYRAALVAHAAQVKLVHWDRGVRILAAKAIGSIAVLSTPDANARLADTLLDGCFAATAIKRHGTVLGLAAVLEALGRRGSAAEVSSSSGGGVGGAAAALAAHFTRIAAVPINMDSQRLFRGRGGEHVRAACAELLRAAAVSGMPLPQTVDVKSIAGVKKLPTVGKHLAFLEETWRQPHEWMQAAAVAAFRDYVTHYSAECAPALEGVVKRTIDGTPITKTPNERRGCLLALGAVTGGAAAAPALVSTVVETVANGVRPMPDAPAEQQDPEARRNATEAAGHLYANFTLQLTASDREKLAGALLAAFDDYAVDKRGDVGSFARVAAIKHVQYLLLLPEAEGNGSAEMTDYWSNLQPSRLIRAVTKQLFERIDRVRNAAGTCLKALAAASDTRQKLFTREDHDATAFLRRIAAASAGIIDWGSPSETFKLVPAAMSCASFVPPVVAGLVLSAGGKDIHVLRPALEHLAGALSASSSSGSSSSDDPHSLVQRASAALEEFIEKHASDPRFAEAAFTLFDRMLDRGVFDAEVASRVVDQLIACQKAFAKDLKTLLPLVPVLATAARHRSPSIRARAQQRMLVLLGSRFPAVRRATSNELLATLAVLSSDDTERHVDQACDILTATAWDVATADVVRGARDRLYEPLGLERPGPTAAGADDEARIQTQKSKKQTYDSYGRLVHEMGF